MACITAILLEPKFSPVWSQYIGLLLPCDVMHTILLDASYAGIAPIYVSSGRLLELT
jgi:hypothetical protein